MKTYKIKEAKETVYVQQYFDINFVCVVDVDACNAVGWLVAIILDKL